MRNLFPIVLLFIALALTACGRSAERVNNDGNEAFANQDYEGALTAYLDAQAELPDSPEPAYNAGNVHYRQEDYEQSQGQFERALLDAQGELTENSFYNLGNTLYSTQEFESAIEAYKETLRANPGDVDAKHNLELALRQQQEQEAQQCQNPQQDNQDQEQDDQQDDQQQDQQDKEQDGQQDDQQQSQQDQQQDDQQDDQQQGQQDQQPQGQPQQVQGLTPEQARQLLEAASQGTESLQEYLEQMRVFPGAPPAQDW